MFVCEEWVGFKWKRMPINRCIKARRCLSYSGGGEEVCGAQWKLGSGGYNKLKNILNKLKHVRLVEEL